MKKDLFIILPGLLLISCTKPKETDWVAVNTQYLTAGVWQFSSYSYYGSFPSTHTTYADLPACRQDDQARFYADGSGEINEGPTTCNVGNPQTNSIQWRFTDQIAHEIEISGIVYYIDKLDAHHFEYHKKTPMINYGSEVSHGYSR
jgi:hypothetical protein